MRIKKTSQTTPVEAEIVNIYSTSTTTTYSADYINKINRYSTTEETIVGVWIDNKPIYRKVINIGSITNTSGNNIVNPNIDNLDTLISLDGMFKVSDNIIPINFYNSVTASGSYSFCCFYSNNNLYILCKTAINSGFVIMEYTKTID